MAEEIQEAVQIIRVAYDGIEIAMKVGSGGIAAMQKAIDFLKGMLDYEKSLGKTSIHVSGRDGTASELHGNRLHHAPYPRGAVYQCHTGNRGQ